MDGRVSQLCPESKKQKQKSAADDRVASSINGGVSEAADDSDGWKSIVEKKSLSLPLSRYLSLSPPPSYRSRLSRWLVLRPSLRRAERWRMIVSVRSLSGGALERPEKRERKISRE